MSQKRKSSLITEEKPVHPSPRGGIPDTNNQANVRQYQMPEATRLYASLKKQLREEGFFEKQPRFYTGMIVLVMSLFVASVSLLLLIHNFELQLLHTILLAFVTTQLGLLGHDAGHRQIFHERWKNRTVGLITGNLLLGISNAYWIAKHDEHHSNPNQTDVDPDLDIPLLAFAEQDIQK